MRQPYALSAVAMAGGLQLPVREASAAPKHWAADQVLECGTGRRSNLHWRLRFVAVCHHKEGTMAKLEGAPTPVFPPWETAKREEPEARMVSWHQVGWIQTSRLTGDLGSNNHMHTHT